MPPAAPSTTTAAAAAAAGGPPPNQTLYVSNLPDTKIRKPDLRLALYTLFSTYGVVLDVVALLTMKHRGQAHIVFRDVASATTAMRELQGFRFLGKDMKIQYARGRSHKLMKLEGTFAPVRKQDAAVTGGAAFVALPGAAPTSDAELKAGVKRPREEEDEEGAREAGERLPPGEKQPQVQAKQQQEEEEESEGEEMEMDEDD